MSVGYNRVLHLLAALLHLLTMQRGEADHLNLHGHCSNPFMVMVPHPLYALPLMCSFNFLCYKDMLYMAPEEPSIRVQRVSRLVSKVHR